MNCCQTPSSPRLVRPLATRTRRASSRQATLASSEGVGVLLTHGPRPAVASGPTSVGVSKRPAARVVIDAVCGGWGRVRRGGGGVHSTRRGGRRDLIVRATPHTNGSGAGESPPGRQARGGRSTTVARVSAGAALRTGVCVALGRWWSSPLRVRVRTSRRPQPLPAASTR